jgi:hypothetical protein
MANMNEIEKEIARFEALVPLGDEASMVLKAHLILEESLWQFLAARLPQALIESLQGENSPVSSGKALIQLAEAVAARDELPTSNSAVLWTALYKVNSLRNRLAHELEPARKKIVSLMSDISQIVMGHVTEHPSRDFYDATKVLVGYLLIDRRPITFQDLE